VRLVYVYAHSTVGSAHVRNIMFEVRSILWTVLKTVLHSLAGRVLRLMLIPMRISDMVRQPAPSRVETPEISLALSRSESARPSHR
jgi:hypothetical protein